MAAFAQLGAGNALCAIEVHYLAVLVQVIEVPAPVRPDSEDIHIVVADIIDFLAVVFLGYHLIGNAEGLHGLDAVHQRLLHINLAAVFVEVRGSDAHDQVVAQLLRPAQQVYVSVVQQVERAVGDDFLHSLILRLGGVRLGRRMGQGRCGGAPLVGGAPPDAQLRQRPLPKGRPRTSPWRLSSRWTLAGSRRAYRTSTTSLGCSGPQGRPPPPVRGDGCG